MARPRLLALIAFFAFFSCLVMAEEARERSIPSRIPKVAVGDWVEFRRGDLRFRHRVDRIERTGSETFVHFTIEALDDDGNVIEKAADTVAGVQEQIMNRRYGAAFRERGMFGVVRNLSVGEKTVATVVFIDPKTLDEFSFSDEVGVLNLIRFEPGDGDEGERFVCLDFGGAAGSE